MQNVEDAARIAEFKYDSSKHTIVWLFVQSSCHRAFADDALNVNKINMCPGGMQPVMQDKIWAGRTQKLVDDNCVPKGMQ